MYSILVDRRGSNCSIHLKRASHGEPEFPPRINKHIFAPADFERKRTPPVLELDALVDCFLRIILIEAPVVIIPRAKILEKEIITSDCNIPAIRPVFIHEEVPC